MRSTALTRRVPLAVCAAGLALFAASPALAGADHGRGEGPLTAYSPDVPSDATARVKATYDSAGRTVVTLQVWGLRPFTQYGAHAHTKPCGLTGADAGPHFQNSVDPVQPSVDPTYANPRNEIWLDLTTNGSGHGTAQAKVDWQFAPDRRAHSVIIHAMHTSTAAGTAGTAGPRLACLTVDF